MSSTTIDRINGINSGVAIKAPCRVATTANITLSGEQTIDGVAVVAGDRVLVKNQTSGVDNGVYVASTSTWQRDLDFNGNRDIVTGTMVYVTLGTSYTQTMWAVTTASPVIGSTSISFEQLAAISTGTYLPLAGGTLTGTLNGVAVTLTGLMTTAASASGSAGIRLPHGTAPSAPTNGDLWTTTSLVQVRINGTTKTLAYTSDYLALAGGTVTGDVTLDTAAQILLDDSITSAGVNLPLAFDGDTDTGFFRPASNTIACAANSTESWRVDGNGTFYHRNSTAALVNGNAVGVVIGADNAGNTALGTLQCSRDQGPALHVNRKTDDGALVSLYQDGTVEGTISVSGNTISYNAFLGSHWAQLSDGSKPEILRGTVMDTINEMCQWPGENNDRLPKVKISDTLASASVYGVFLAWDDDDTRTNDMYVASLGAGYVRMASGQVLQRGDLVESNGNGCAKVQDDNVIKSSTVGKISAAVSVADYSDGSFLVPCILMCG